MPEVVCNTSPLQYLHQIGILEILPALYGGVLVPMAVVDEISAGLRVGVNLPDLSTLDWVGSREVAPPFWPMPRDIHRSEAEVLALAGTLRDAKFILVPPPIPEYPEYPDFRATTGDSPRGMTLSQSGPLPGKRGFRPKARGSGDQGFPRKKLVQSREIQGNHLYHPGSPNFQPLFLESPSGMS